jgi:site-specific recombinase XerD
VGLTARAKGQFTAGAVRQMLRRQAKRAGVTGRVNPHSFRHMFACEYLLSGGDLATLADLLGHSSVEVTKTFYAIFTFSGLQHVHSRHSPIARMRRENGDS